MFTKYDKFLLAVLGALAQVVQVQYGTNHYVQIVLAVLTALGVFVVPNKAAV
jgi:hypothetical protein